MVATISLLFDLEVTGRNLMSGFFHMPCLLIFVLAVPAKSKGIAFNCCVGLADATGNLAGTVGSETES